MVVAKHRHEFTVRMLGETLEFLIEERMRQLRVPLTPEEKRYTTYRDDKIVTEASGELRIRLRQSNSYNNRDWIDKPDAPIESRLIDIIIGMVKEANKSRTRAAEIAERERLWEMERQARADAEERRRHEQERVNALLGASDRWMRAQQLRNFVQHVVAVGGAPCAGDDLPGWASWALSVAEHIDPTYK